MTKRSRQKLKYLENKKGFWREIKAFFVIFKGLSTAKYCFRPESATLLQPRIDHHYNIPNKKLSPSRSKCFPIEMFTGEKRFLLRKELKWITKTVHIKCTKSAESTKSSFVVQIIISVITLLSCFISLVFDYQWISRVFHH